MAGFSSKAVRRRVAARVIVAALVSAVALAGCSGDDEGNGGQRQAARQSGPTPAGAPSFGVTVVSAEVQAMSPQPPAFPEDVKAAVSASLDAYLSNGVVGPLRTGKPPSGGLEAVFTDAALGRLAAPGPDRAALLEEGTPVAGDVRQDRAKAALTALTAPGGEIVLVTAQLDVAHTVTSRGRAVAVVRSGELVLVPFGGWRIEAYDMRTARDTQPGGAR